MEWRGVLINDISMCYHCYNKVFFSLKGAIELAICRKHQCLTHMFHEIKLKGVNNLVKHDSNNVCVILNSDPVKRMTLHRFPQKKKQITFLQDSFLRDIFSTNCIW